MLDSDELAKLIARTLSKNMYDEAEIRGMMVLLQTLNNESKAEAIEFARNAVVRNAPG